MSAILEKYIDKILIATVALVFIIGVAILISIDMNNHASVVLACIEAGNQVIEGDCVK
jgi:hypothetical protein